MITIKRPAVVIQDDKARLIAEVDIDGVQSSLWFEVDRKYEQYLCFERSDAYVLAFLHYAMQYGHDITAEAPMTDRLYEQLAGQFLSAFYKANEGHCYASKIICPLAPVVDKIDDVARIGTGVSCGVDSMHVFAKNASITHGCIWNGHGVNSGETKEQRDAAWNDLVVQASRFTNAAGVELIVGNSNFDRGCMPNLRWDGMTTNGNLFNIFAMQKFWSKYIIASDCAVDNFKFNIKLTEDPAHYEFFMFPFVSLPHIQILMDGADRRRVEKVQDLIDYPLAKEYLNTCWGLHDGHKNCSYLCPKCMRTMLNLWCHDALDDFAKVYDVDYFHRNFHQYLAEYYRGCLQKDFFITEMRPYFQRKKISLRDKVRAWIIVLKKFVRKAIRLGRTNLSFRPD